MEKNKIKILQSNFLIKQYKEFILNRSSINLANIEEKLIQHINFKESEARNRIVKKTISNKDYSNHIKNFFNGLILASAYKNEENSELKLRKARDDLRELNNSPRRKAGRLTHGAIHLLGCFVVCFSIELLVELRDEISHFNVDTLGNLCKNETHFQIWLGIIALFAAIFVINKILNRDLPEYLKHAEMIEIADAHIDCMYDLKYISESYGQLITNDKNFKLKNEDSLLSQIQKTFEHQDPLKALKQIDDLLWNTGKCKTDKTEITNTIVNNLEIIKKEPSNCISKFLGLKEKTLVLKTAQ
jgi:hypothetical protein